MDARQLLNNLLDEISEDERALQEKRSIARFLRERIDREEGAVQTDSVGSSLPPRRVTFLDSIAGVARATDGREFTVSDVYATLESQGVKMESATPKASISTALARLEKAGVIRVTFKGGGNVPNRYQAVSVGTAVDTGSATG